MNNEQLFKSWANTKERVEGEGSESRAGEGNEGRLRMCKRRQGECWDGGLMRRGRRGRAEDYHFI